MAETSEDVAKQIEELLKLFHDEGGVFAALRDIKSELYKLSERPASEEKSSADPELVRKLDERVANLGPRLEEMQTALRSLAEAGAKERSALQGEIEKPVRALEQSLAAAREEFSKSLKEVSDAAAARSSDAVLALEKKLKENVASEVGKLEKTLLEKTEATAKQAESQASTLVEHGQTLGRIAGALTSHGDSLDKLATFVRGQSENSEKQAASAFADLHKQLGTLEGTLRALDEERKKSVLALEGALTGVRKALEARSEEQAKKSAEALRQTQAALTKAVADGEEQAASRAAAFDKRLKETAAETLTLKAHLETFAEGQRAMAKYFDERRKRDEEAKARERKEEAREANNRGAALYHRGAYEAAVLEFQRALEIDSKMAEAHNNLGLAYSQLKKNKEAVEAFKKALALDSGMGEAYNNLGLLYHLGAEYGKAVEMFQASLQKNANPSVAYTNLGNSYYEAKKFKEAVAAWQKALEFNPLNKDAKRALEMFHKETS
ncbi:MAG: tetratricopeptide repeat protein [Acidobacteriota bacterium]|nr:MAG: tetratricopeptide repeat protein [Acidobacteriota bacterium]